MASLYLSTTMVQEAIKLAPAPKTPLREQLTNRERAFGTLQVLVDIVKRKERLAQFSNPEGEGNRVDKDAYDTLTITPPYIKEYRSFSIRELLARFPGKSLDSIPRESVLDSMAETMVDLFNATVRREEWILSQFYQTGKVTITGPDIPDFSLDLEMKASHKITLSGNYKWGGSTAEILKNWDDWCQLVLQDSGGKFVDKAFFGTKAKQEFLGDPDIRELLDNRRIEIIKVMHEKQPDGTIKFAEFQGVGCFVHPITYDNNGTATNLWATNKVLLAASSARATRYYGAILDFDAITGNFRTVQNKYFGKPIRSPRNGTIDLMLQTASLPVPEEVDSYACTTVTNA